MATDNKTSKKKDPDIGSDGYPLQGRAAASKIAKFLGISARTVYRLMEAGELESYVMNGSVRGDWQNVRSYLAKSKRPTKVAVVNN